MAKPSTTSTRALYESFLSLSKTWPKDPVRPNLHFGDSIRRAASEAFLNPPASLAAAHESGEDAKLNDKDFKSLDERTQRYAEKSAEALRRIKDGRAAKEYPTPASILKPASNPEYYDRLLLTLDRAANGQKTGVSFADRVRIFFGRN